jgi:hypothetical protein
LSGSKEQFTSQMNPTKARISEIDAKIAAQRQMKAGALRTGAPFGKYRANCKTFRDADWTTKTGVIRARIEIGQKNVAVVLRSPTDTVGVCSTQLW